MKIALALQVILGTATVWLVIALGRQWMRPSAALIAGLITALWPHLITFTGVLLSETLFGFALALSLWLLCMRGAERSARGLAIAGFAWGLTYLINPIVAVFPFVTTSVLAVRLRKIFVLCFLICFTAVLATWALRNAVVAVAAGPLQGIEENFVQGSWPLFFVAYNSRFNNEISSRIVEAVNGEIEQLEKSPATGMKVIAERMLEDPPFYLAWYCFEKPYLLWDWSIRVGTGDIYFLPVQHSLFNRIPVLSVFAGVLRLLNPLFFALAAVASVATLLAAFLSRRRQELSLLVTSLLFLYVTGVHVVLQSEPRYSIPYRPEEILLAVTAVTWVIERLRQQMGSVPSPDVSSLISNAST